MLKHRLPSPASALAFGALFVALSATAVALPGTGTVNSGDIKNNTIRGKDVRNGTLTGKDVKNDRLTGKDLDESTLGKVPAAVLADAAAAAKHATTAGSATTATTAKSATQAGNAATVAGQTMRTYDLSVAPGGAAQTFTFGGVELSATCNSGESDLDARNVSGVAAAYQSTWINNTGANDQPDEDFDSGDADDAGSVGSGTSNVSVSFANGSVTTILGAFQDAGQTGGDCHYWGRVIAG